ncbi:NAD-dependent epimerase/dehydratase family protein [Granulicella sibirica]|uniref:dTDP-glucose 4,6-dehydratase n=1 Tax=Granulicella sibirica TaxID=2479048 RepID=A0A4Q0T4J9_9BACT|nr:NAD(P)-dependent oxidoreductase [Granulicella sibirica]RXH56968.1 dTDP-glucose 4,6-dehydratase [Granulicella sibirica]
MAKPLSRLDLDHILQHTQTLLPAMAGERIFVTGGTGFFGHWLLESFLHANRELGLNARATVLTRDAGAFRDRSPHIASDPAIALLEGDVKAFAFPEAHHRFVVHAATDSGGQQTGRPPYELAESILEGTRHTLRFARETKARRLLFTSTGAVYGRGISGITHIPETYPGAPDPMQPGSSYDEAKRMSEHLCVAHAHETPLECSVARCFAFVGPHLPLDAHFAIGNFIRDAIAGTPIHIRGDGTPLRSYLYAADLAIWLWTMLFTAPRDRAYNVGSEEQYSIGSLAHLTAETLRPMGGGGSRLRVQVDGKPTLGTPISTYVPSTQKAKSELGLRQHISLEDAIRRTAEWHGYAVV